MRNQLRTWEIANVDTDCTRCQQQQNSYNIIIDENSDDIIHKQIGDPHIHEPVRPPAQSMLNTCTYWMQSPCVMF